MKTAEPNGPLEIQPNFLAEQADVDALVAGIELGFDIASQPAFRDLIQRWVVPPRRLSRQGTVAFLRRSCSSYFHPVGTCATGSGREAVVDAELRVPRRRGPADRRRLGHADDPLGQHQRADRHDRGVRVTAAGARPRGRA
jgi:choline dehydrogenase-like flavoprotein